MSYNPKNYQKQGGDEWVIGGTLTISPGATVAGMTEAAVLSAASASALGGVIAATAGAGDTVECKINASTKKLYVAPPAAATAAAAGVVKAAANQADSTADAVADLVDDFNALLAKLVAAGLMAAE